MNDDRHYYYVVLTDDRRFIRRVSGTLEDAIGAIGAEFGRYHIAKVLLRMAQWHRFHDVSSLFSI